MEVLLQIRAWYRLIDPLTFNSGLHDLRETMLSSRGWTGSIVWPENSLIFES